MMKYLLISSAALILIGAGCSRSSPTVLDAYGDGAGGLKMDDTFANNTSTETHKTSPQPMPSQEPLAFPGDLGAKEVDGKTIRIKTNLGDIVIQLAHAEGPKAASNFYYLVKHGFYDGTIFHRVIPGFMIQGGDPTGTGRGDPGYRFQNDEVKIPYDDGVVAMANAGRDTNGSQFFIMVENYPLPPDYSIFGKVIEGLDVAHKIADVPRSPSDRPNKEVRMERVTIE